MRAYIDSSVLLRLVFEEPNPLKELSKIRYGISSELIRVECLRTADRYRLVNEEPEGDFLKRLSLIHDVLDRIELIRLAPEILNRASQSFPTAIKTLDAIHLSTCLLYRERNRANDEKSDVIFCSHDNGLKKAARAMGLQVLG